MSTLILDGRATNDKFTDSVLAILAEELRNTGEDVEAISVRSYKIAHCTGCFSCWLSTPGRCSINDDGQKIPKSISQNNQIIFFTPVVFGGYHPLLKNAIERSIPVLLPFFNLKKGEMHHPTRSFKHYDLFGVGLFPEEPKPEQDKTFKEHVRRNALNFNSRHTGACTINQDQQPAEIKDALIKLFREKKEP
jgi:hypothetical protein